MTTKLFELIVASFDNTKIGFSSRKLTAFATMIMIAYCHFRFVDASNVVEVILIDMGFVLVLFGMTTYSNIKLTPQPKQTDENH
jgi:hypothetical protein